jgi:hypothetical protein
VTTGPRRRGSGCWLAQETSWQGNDNSGRFRVTLMAVRADEGWLLAQVHIGPLQAPPERPS